MSSEFHPPSENLAELVQKLTERVKNLEEIQSQRIIRWNECKRGADGNDEWYVVNLSEEALFRREVATKKHKSEWYRIGLQSRDPLTDEECIRLWVQSLSQSSRRREESLCSHCENKLHRY